MTYEAKAPPASVISAKSATRTVSTAVVIVCRQSEPSREQFYRLVEDSGVLRFWDAAGEDVYDLNDGAPV